MNFYSEAQPIELDFWVNGVHRQIQALPGARLLDILRDQLGLTGTKEGCGIGECGACTILFDGEPANACLISAIQLQGHQITTIEGLGGKDGLHPLQQSFIDNNAVGCGFCTPGAILSAKALLDKHPHPTQEQIRVAMSGNLCRCTGYEAFVKAIEYVAQQTPDTPSEQESSC